MTRTHVASAFRRTCSGRLKAAGTVSVASILCVLGVLRGGVVLHAQFQMPDPKQMSGIPRPVTDLPDGSITVLVVRGSVTNGLPGQTVTLHVGSKTESKVTDSAGRVQFDNLPAGETLKAEATIDGEHLESQPFPAPAQGGVRLLLAATDKEKAAEASAPAVNGQVTFGGQSRVILEPGDESVTVYYVLDIQNPQKAPVNPTTPLVIDLPKGALGASALQGSSPLASVSGTRVRVNGPLPPGSTMVQVAYEMPANSGTFTLEQTLPASVEQFAVIAEKIPGMQLSSPLIAQQQDVTQQGQVFIAAEGAPVAAGHPLTLTLTGLPHHSPAPRLTALSLALGIILVGVWFATRTSPGAATAAVERKRLVDRREKLMKDLVRLERDHASGRVDDRRYASRREELVTALERVYGALEDDSPAPDPTSNEGVAA